MDSTQPNNNRFRNGRTMDDTTVKIGRTNKSKSETIYRNFKRSNTFKQKNQDDDKMTELWDTKVELVFNIDETSLEEIENSLPDGAKINNGY